MEVEHFLIPLLWQDGTNPLNNKAWGVDYRPLSQVHFGYHLAAKFMFDHAGIPYVLPDAGEDKATAAASAN